MSVTWKLDFNHFDALADALPERADDLAEVTAEIIRDRAEENTERIDTGDMKDGWRVAPLGDGLWVVYNEMSYAIFNELGTYKLPASPMLAPAFADTEGDFPVLAAGFWRLP